MRGHYSYMNGIALAGRGGGGIGHASSSGSGGDSEGMPGNFTWRPGDKLMVRATIIETKRSRSKPDRGIMRTFIETIN